MPSVDKVQDTAAHFSRHPAYISSLVHRETGAAFSEIVQDMRMKRARYGQTPRGGGSSIASATASGAGIAIQT